MSGTDPTAAIEAAFRIEFPRLVAGLTRFVGDIGLAEELAQDTLVDALVQWPEQGTPRNPGAWLMAVGKRKAIDRFRRDRNLDGKYAEIGRGDSGPDPRSAAPPGTRGAFEDHIDDDVLRLMFVACHPILSVRVRTTLTLRLVGGLTTTEIARAYLEPEATVGRADHPGQAHDRRGRDPVRGAGGRGSGAATRVGARGDLRHVQRGLLGDGRRGVDAPRALRRGAPARAGAVRAGPRRAGGPRPDGPDGGALVTAALPERARR